MALAFIAVASSACSRPPLTRARVLVHRLTLPTNPEGVFLNEDLVFYFSSEVDRASVTHESVRIRSESGEEARGTLQVDGERVRFVPAPVLAADLSDGGYKPGTKYAVEIKGFPRPDGLRGTRGEPLERTYSWSFVTVRATAERSGPIFDDRRQNRFGQLRIFPIPSGGQGAPCVIGTEDSIYLACDKPLDPSSVHDSDFEIFANTRAGERIGVSARLIENEADAAPRLRNPAARSSSAIENWDRERRAALLELTPKQRLAPADYQLRIDAAGSVHSFSLRDFSGHPVRDPSLPPVAVHVVEATGDSGRGVLHEAFLDTRLRSPVAVPGVDGTAYWGDTGRVEVRYPAAAGSGSDGEVVLAPAEPRDDVHSVRLRLPAQRTCALRSAPGLVVLRSQGKLSIEGRLERMSGEGTNMVFEKDHNLSDWLDRARATNSNWTVLVAGCDLVIDGEVHVSTPLLLCAGGVIRIAGSVKAGEKPGEPYKPGELYILREGGGLNSMATIAPLEIDAPRDNPLVEPLHLAVMSGPIPPSGEVLRWKSAEARGSAESRGARSGGRWSVRYVREGQSSASTGAVDSPRLLDQPGSLQLLIELTVEPGPIWDPPFVDYVHLEWEQAKSGGAPR